MAGIQISNAQAAAIASGQKTSGQVRQEISQNAARNDGVLSSSSSSSLSDVFSKLSDITNYNNQWTAQQADKAMQFNRDEAQKSRDWQEYMSNTAHQREVKDLIKAGLNPVLSAMGGNGAPVTSGATASGYAPTADTSLSSGLVQLFGILLNSQTELANKALDAQTNLTVADKYNETSKWVSALQSQTQLSTANIHAMASKYAADTGAQASKAVAAIHAAAQKYGYDVSAMTQKEIAGFNAYVNSALQEDKQAHDFDIEKYTSGAFGIKIPALSDAISEGISDVGSATGLSTFLDDMLGLFTGKGFNSYSGSRR